MKRVILLFLLAVSSWAQADWTLVLKNPEFGENYYVDLRTLEEVEGVMQITTMQDFPTNKKKPAKARPAHLSAAHAFPFAISNAMRGASGKSSSPISMDKWAQAKSPKRRHPETLKNVISAGTTPHPGLFSRC